MINIFCGIVGTATGQSWWLGYADDLLFAAMDVGCGYKSASEVGLELAKTVSYGFEV